MFKSFIDYFIHPGLKLEKSVYEKAKISILVFLLSLLIVVIYSIFYYFKASVFDIKALHNYVGIVVLSIALFLVKKYGKIDFALAQVAFFSEYLVASSIYLSGGLPSNDILWFYVVSASAFMFVNYKIGITISVISGLLMTLFYFLEIYDLSYKNEFSFTLTTDYRYFNFLLILTLLSIMFYLLVRGNQRLQEIIQNNKEQQIRVEIARDFHDQIGNKLASLQHLTELIKLSKTENEKNEIVLKINDNAKLVYDNFRDFIWTLDNNSDSVSELFMYLRDFTDDYFRFSDLNVYISSQPESLPNIHLPGKITKEIIPIFKEAVTNISKHSQAKNLHLKFLLIENNFEIVLFDDGIGFDIEIIKKGKGLGNIVHRANRSGGEIQITSFPNKGTEIKFMFKLPSKGSAISLGNS